MGTPAIIVSTDGHRLRIAFPYNAADVERVKTLPERRFMKREKKWSAAPILANFKALDELFGDRLQFDDGAAEMRAECYWRLEQQKKIRARKAAGVEPDTRTLNKLPLALPLKPHQQVGATLAAGAYAFGYFMDQGTGKTATVIADALWAFMDGKIEGMIILAPNAVKTNWVGGAGREHQDEIGKFISDTLPLNKAVWVAPSGRRAKQSSEWKRFMELVSSDRGNGMFHVAAFNIEGLSTDDALNAAKEIAEARRFMVVVDESTRIKSQGSIRTESAQQLRALCPMARILSGTPLLKSPLDAWSQMNFLDPDILPWASYYAFRNRFAIISSYTTKQVVAYKNLPELSEIIDGISYRVTKEQCLDLPAKVFMRHSVPMAQVQKKAYEQMRKHALLALDEKMNAVKIEEADEKAKVYDCPFVITQLIRLQQIVGGYLPELDGEGKVVGTVELVPPHKNPKLSRAIEIIEDAGEQSVVVWARFREEIAALAKLLERNGISFVQFHGGVSDGDRVKAREAFQRGEAKVFLGNPKAGGTGLNLYKGTVVVYVSQDFSTEDRVQSEDRCHRIGTTQSVTYHDIVCEGSLDNKIITTLRNNRSVSDVVMKDGFREWI